MELTRGVVTGELYVGFNKENSRVFVGDTKEEAAEYLMKFPEHRVFWLVPTRTNCHEVEVVPPQPATVKVKDIDSEDDEVSRG